MLYNHMMHSVFTLQDNSVSLQTKTGCSFIYEFIISFSSSPPPAPEPTEHSYKEMIVIQGHRSKELYPHEQIQNRVGNRIATPKWKHVCQVYTFKDHEHQTGFPGSQGFQCSYWGKQTVLFLAEEKWMLTSGHSMFVCIQMQYRVYNQVNHLHVTCDPFTARECFRKIASKVSEE